MIAKIIAYGRTRDEALARLRRAMAETTVVIEGGATNKSFILDLLDQPEVVDGSADTGWIDRVRGEGRLVSHRHSGVALVAAAIEAYEEAEAVERSRLLETAHGGRPQVQHQVGRAIDLKLRGTAYKVTVARTGPHRFRVSIAANGDEHVVDAELDRLDRYASRLRIAGRSHRLVTATHGPVHLVEVDGVTHRVSRDEGGVLRSPAPALVVATPVAVGDEVAAGAPVLVLESMKMETVLPAPFAAGSGSCWSPPAARSRPARRWCGSSRSATPTRRWRRRRRERRARPAGRAPAETTAQSARPAAGPTCAPWCWASTSTRATRDGRCRATSPRATSSSRRGARRSPTRSPSGSSPTSPSSAATGPPTRSATPSSGCTAPGSTSTPTCRASTSSAGACPTSSGAGWPGAGALRRHGPRPHARAGGGGLPHLPGPAAQCPRRPAGHDAAAALARRARPEPPADQARPRRPRPAGARHPAALPGRRRPGPQRPVPLVRPAARRRRAGRRARRGARRARRPRSRARRRRTTRPGSTRSPPSPSRSSASSPSGWSTACPSGSRCSRCWSGATTASTSCTT